MTKSKFAPLLKWSQSNYQQLPWRKNRTMYGTLVSEIMLQQTTVGTVLNHFEKFLKRFPTIQSLAKASDEELAVEWKGLGYYRRARNLKNCAIEISQKFKGEIPLDRDVLLKIKGIGDYTADALLAIGANQKAIAVDANLERVLARLYAVDAPKGLKLQKTLRELFQQKKILQEISTKDYRAINEALMDLGRVYCQARKAHCDLCPMNTHCQAYQLKNPLAFPVHDGTVDKKKSVEHELHLLRLVVKKKDQILVYKKNNKEWLTDQWELPTLVISSTDKTLKQYPILKNKFDFQQDQIVKTGITKYKITNYIHEESMTLKKLKELGFDRECEFHLIDNKANFTTTTFKVLKQLGSKKKK